MPQIKLGQIAATLTLTWHGLAGFAFIVAAPVAAQNRTEAQEQPLLNHQLNEQEQELNNRLDNQPSRIESSQSQRQTDPCNGYRVVRDRSDSEVPRLPRQMTAAVAVENFQLCGQRRSES